MTSEPPVVSKKSPSKLEQLMAGDDFRLAWNNSVRFQLARQLLHLRRFRKWSQARLAKEMKTSQSAVARIEGAEENFSADTVERAVTALHGCFAVSIHPAEMYFPTMPAWWELAADGIASTSTIPLKGIHHNDEDGTLKVVAGWIGDRKSLPVETTPVALLGK
jgi:transcriptional regulator with XRE-family HTH domain